MEAFLVSFGIIFVAELGDKSQLMALTFAARYRAVTILIAITDSGIQWENDDLIDKVYLNYKELVKHKPLHGDGTACGGTGEMAGFDCNGDGILTVSDYKDSPNLTAFNKMISDMKQDGTLTKLRVKYLDSMVGRDPTTIPVLTP